MGLRGASWFAPRRAWVRMGWHPSRAAFRTPCGMDPGSCLPSLGTTRGRSVLRLTPTVGFRSPSEIGRPDPAPSRAPPWGRSADGASSPGLSRPFDTFQVGGSAWWWEIPLPPRAASRVWLPSSRHAPPDPADTAWVPERPWDCPLQGVLPIVMGTPLGAPALLAFAAPFHHLIRVVARGSEEPRQAPLPSGPCSHDGFVRTPAPVGAGRRCLLGVHPSRACSPPCERRLSFAGASPLVLAQVNVSSCVDLRVSSDGGVG